VVGAAGLKVPMATLLFGDVEAMMNHQSLSRCPPGGPAVSSGAAGASGNSFLVLFLFGEGEETGLARRIIVPGYAAMMLLAGVVKAVSGRFGSDRQDGCSTGSARWDALGYPGEWIR
jgi:hypothetical protein